MDDYIDLEHGENGEKSIQRSPKPGTWASMNAIQRTGCLGLFPCMILSLFCKGKVSTFFGLLGWTSILFGWVAGNLWRFRHALHFWWSMVFTSVVHAALLPVYAKLVHEMKDAHGQDGKGYMYLAFALLIAETLSLQILLKRVAMWLHKRVHDRFGGR